MCRIEKKRPKAEHRAAMKGQEMLGRYVGALTNDRRPSDEEKQLFTYLGAAMERESAR